MRRRRLIASVAILAASVLLGVTVAFGVFRGKTLPLGFQSAQAATDSDTYILSSLGVQFPFNLPGNNGAADTTLAGVTFAASWSGTNFPGEADCEVTLKDASGSQVGTETFTATYEQQSVQPPPVVVEVTGEPVSAEGSCGAGTYPSGNGYEFDNMRIGPDESGNEGRSTVTFTAHWTTQDDPSARACELHVALNDDSTLVVSGTIFVPDGTDVAFSAPVSQDRIADASVTCGEIDEG